MKITKLENGNILIDGQGAIIKTDKWPLMYQDKNNITRIHEDIISFEGFDKDTHFDITGFIFETTDITDLILEKN